METIEISKQEARALYKNGSAEMKRKLEEKFSKKDLTDDIRERIKSFEDACADQGLDPENILPYKNPTNDLQRAANSIVRLWIIAKSLRQEWSANWKDGNERKWYPFFEYNPSASGFGFSDSHYVCTFTTTGGGSRLCFPTEELAAYFGKQFIEDHNAVLIVEYKNQ